MTTDTKSPTQQSDSRTYSDSQMRNRVVLGIAFGLVGGAGLGWNAKGLNETNSRPQETQQSANADIDAAMSKAIADRRESFMDRKGNHYALSTKLVGGAFFGPGTIACKALAKRVVGYSIDGEPNSYEPYWSHEIAVQDALCQRKMKPE